MNILSTLILIVSALATIATAIATAKIERLTSETKKSQDKFQEQLSDLYQAIVIATLLSSNSSPSVFSEYKNKFKEAYKGKTEIFKN